MAINIDKTQLIGLTWNTVPAPVKAQLYAAFQATPGQTVEQFNADMRVWISDAWINVTGQEAALAAITAANPGCAISQPVKTTDNRSVVSADQITDVDNYGIYHPILHNCPFLILTSTDFPVVNP